MKNKVKLFGIIVLMAVMFFGFVGIVSAQTATSGTQAPVDYRGTWNCHCARVTINESQLIIVSSNDRVFTSDIISWRSVTNTGRLRRDFPTGVEFIVKCIDTDETETMRFILHRNKRQMCVDEYLDFDIWLEDALNKE